MGIWRKGFQSKSCGTGGQISCQIHQEQIQEQRNLGHGRSEATVRVGIFDPAGPRLGDRHETGCERGQENGTDVLENPVLVLVPGSREQIHDAFDVIKVERMQGVVFVARDPKKPEEPEERGRSTPVTAIQMEKGTIVCKTAEADVANVAVDDSMEITISLLGATVEKNVRTEKTLRGFGRNDLSQNEKNVSILARYGKKMPNADAGSLDDRRSPCQLIQIIVRLRPAHAKAVWKDEDKVDSLRERETIRGGQEPKTKGMLVWADSRWTLEKLQVEMQLVKGVNGFIYRIRKGGQVQCGVRLLPDQLSEVRARMLPNDVRYTDDNRHIQELQQWRLGPLPYTMQPPEIVDMLLEWSRKSGVPLPVVPKAPDPRQRTKNGHFWFVAAEGPSFASPPLSGKSS